MRFITQSPKSFPNSIVTEHVEWVKTQRSIDSIVRDIMSYRFKDLFPEVSALSAEEIFSRWLAQNMLDKDRFRNVITVHDDLHYEEKFVHYTVDIDDFEQLEGFMNSNSVDGYLISFVEGMDGNKYLHIEEFTNYDY